MNKSKTNLSYVFITGRNERLQQKTEYAKEFFYGYQSIDLENFNLDIIEMYGQKSNLFINRILKFVEKVVNKLTNLPTFYSEVVTLNNIKKVFKADIVLATNDRIGLSILPIIIISKMFKKSKFISFAMGIFSNKESGKVISFIQSMYLRLFFIVSNKILFISKSEFQIAKNNYKKYINKFIYLPFSVDQNFWIRKKEYNSSDLNKILFIGNDGKRDYDLVFDIAKTMKDKNFVFLSRNLPEETSKLHNVELYIGDWNSNIFSDEFLRNIYEQSVLSIIPVKNSTQPSGQSVGLQSMMMGVPVMITKTMGFWDYDEFNHGENIYFVNENNINQWEKHINSLLSDKSLLNSLSKNGNSTVKNKFSLKNFSENLKSILNS